MNAANFLFEHECGPIYGYITPQGIRNLVLPHPENPIHPYMLHTASNIVLGWRLHEQLEQYFAGLPVALEDAPLDLSGTTPFQQEVWAAVQAVPRGETRSYGEIAEAVGRDANAARAVGRAVGANPIHLLIPCHRVVGADGGLVNFAAGLAWKKRLLDLESMLRC